MLLSHTTQSKLCQSGTLYKELLSGFLLIPNAIMDTRQPQVDSSTLNSGIATQP